MPHEDGVINFPGILRQTNKPMHLEAADYGVTLTLLNCEVLRVVVLPLATAMPM
jgi:hypothetical protein